MSASEDLTMRLLVADRIMVIRLGRVAGTFDRRTTSREDVVAAITGALPQKAMAA